MLTETEHSYEGLLIVGLLLAVALTMAVVVGPAAVEVWERLTSLPEVVS